MNEESIPTSFPGSFPWLGGGEKTLGTRLRVFVNEFIYWYDGDGKC